MRTTDELIATAPYGGLVAQGRAHQQDAHRTAQIQALQSLLMTAHARARALGLQRTQTALRDAGRVLIDEKRK